MSNNFAQLSNRSIVARTTTSEIAQHIKAWCVQAGISNMDIQPRDPSLNGSEARSLPMADLLIVEQYAEGPEPIERLEAIARAAPTTTLTVFILANPTATELRRLFHAGANDVLNAASTEPELFAALNATLSDGERLSADKRTSGKILSVVKSAGGVGASSVSANLARTLQDLKAGRIVLVDLDIQFSGLTACLDLKPRLTLIDALRAGDRLDPTLLRSLFIEHRSGFQILAGPSEITAADALTPEFVSKLIAQLKSEFDLIILDLPMTWSDWFAEALAESNLIVPVLQPSVRSADGARRILDALEDLGLATNDIQPVINALDRTPAAKERAAGLSSIFKATKPITIREDQKSFQRAGDLGQCLLDLGGSSAQHDYTYAAREIADFLSVEIEADAPTHSDRKIGLKLFGERR